ncbi:MAG: hypothetical protein QXU69_08430, partial [Thermofilaceae archaeon]
MAARQEARAPLLKCFDRIVVHDVRVGEMGFSATYTLEMEGVRKSYRLMHRYRESIKVKGLEEIARL